ncbi:MAG TPA: D-aminoacylase, partial [Thermomicrobiales bacterium]|nr:D-aminoacylase [Thermomicrobiales bacterium]
GTGNAWFYGDLAITGDRIERIAPPGTIDPGSAGTVIDATGHVVSPGFIDVQSHSIIPFLRDGRSLSKITQGVTTEILGEDWTPAPVGGRNDSAFGRRLDSRMDQADIDRWTTEGDSWSRFGDWLAAFEKMGLSVNFGSFLGGGTVRKYGMGEAMGDATPEAIAEMRRIVAESMEDGAFGVATALIYPPNSYSTTSELIEVMEVVAAYNGVHITHLRSEGDQFLEAIDEQLEIARATGVITEIYHLKAAGRKNWPKMEAAIQKINEARARGIDITADMYPYPGAGTGLAACVPPWAAADGKLYENLRDPETRAKILEEMRTPTGFWENLGEQATPEGVILAQFSNPDLQKYQGWRLAEVASDLGMDWHETVLYLLETEGHNIFSMYLAMSEDNMKLQFQQEWMRFGTDAGGMDPEWAEPLGLVHPRAYGTYTRILGRYVRELGWMTLEDAIRKASSAVADRLGLRDRGLLRDGMKADVIVFDPDTVRENSTYTAPHKLSTGIRDVFVNGTPVLRDGTHTGALPGQRVNGPGYKG